MRLHLLVPATLATATVACGHTSIRVDGVMRESSEMRPLQNVPADAYKQLRLLVKTAGGDSAQGTEQCGYARLEGTLESDDLKNAACVPSDAPNDAVRLVRQRLRAYGAQVVRDGTEAYDYTVDVHVAGLAPKQPDRMAARAVARLTFALRPDDDRTGYFTGVDVAAAGAAFAGVARDCSLKDVNMASFSASATQPMNPEFDLMALTANAVDNAFGCDQLARFFRDAHTRFPRAAPPSPIVPAPAPAAPLPPPPPPPPPP